MFTTSKTNPKNEFITISYVDCVFIFMCFCVTDRIYTDFCTFNTLVKCRYLKQLRQSSNWKQVQREENGHVMICGGKHTEDNQWTGEE